MWQDWVIFVSSMILNYAVFLMVLDQDTAVNWKLSLMQAIALLAMAVANFSLNLIWSSGSVLLGSLLWFFILIFRRTNNG